MAEVLNQVRDSSGPVIIGGDLNSSAKDGTPTSVTYEIKKRVSDPRFWVKQGIRWFSPIAIPSVIVLPLNLWKNHHDPTAHQYTSYRSKPGKARPSMSYEIFGFLTAAVSISAEIAPVAATAAAGRLQTRISAPGRGFIRRTIWSAPTLSRARTSWTGCWSRNRRASTTTAALQTPQSNDAAPLQ